MAELLFTLLIISIVVLLFFNAKWTSKRNMIMSNTLLQSEATTKTIDQMSQEEEKLQDESVMRNKRYRILHSFMMDEVRRIKAMSLDQAREKFPDGQSKRVIMHPDMKLVIRLDSELMSSSSPAIKVTVYPKRLLGIFAAAEMWVFFESSNI